MNRKLDHGLTAHKITELLRITIFALATSIMENEWIIIESASEGSK